jgi:hypothetical protein
MYKPSSHLVITYFPTYVPIYIYIYGTYFPTELVTKVKPNINSVKIHPQLSKNGAFSGWWTGGWLVNSHRNMDEVSSTQVSLHWKWTHIP